jgi:hypothetical protein
MSNVIVKLGQTLYDIALQCYGCPEGVFFLMEDNLLGVDSEITDGQKLTIRDLIPDINGNNLRVVNQLLFMEVKPNSNFIPVEADFEALDFENIDFNAL